MDVAERKFAAAGSPMQFSARYYRANALYDSSRTAEGLSLADALLAQLPNDYRALRAYALWTRASCMARLKRFYASLDAAKESASLFDSLGETDNAVSIRLLTISALSYLGQDHEAWQLRRDLFAAAGEVGNPRTMEALINAAARAEEQRGRWPVARALFALQLSSPSILPRVRFNGVVESSLLSALDEARPLSVAERASIREAGAAIPDPKQREEALDEWRFAEAATVRDTNPAAAARMLTETIAYLRAANRPVKLPRVLAERAKALRRLEDTAGALADLQEAVALLESERTTVASFDLRDSFFGTADQTFHDLADVLFALDRNGDALTATEKARARVVIDLLGEGGGTHPFTADEIARMLPVNTSLVSLTELADRTVVTTIRHGVLRTESLAIGRAQLSALVRDLLDRKGEHVTGPLDDLGAACAAGAGAAETVVIVPDAVTAQLPFACLRNGSTGRYLIEDHRLVAAPSATAYIRARALRPASTTPQRALLIGNPAFDAQRFPSLDRLPDAEMEAERIARLYGDGVTRIGKAADRQSLLQLANGFDMIHLATHAISSPRDPAWSVAVLAPSPGDDGLLYGQDVAGLSLKARAPVVVLAGCKTARGSAAGAIRNLANAFLAAGARTVIATLWNVDDRKSRELLTAFHEELRRGTAPAEALRSAQLKMLRLPDTKLHGASAWAGFQVIGSDE